MESILILAAWQAALSQGSAAIKNASHRKISRAALEVTR
jgi:hypothetical protein